jgi:MFS family permease
MSRMPETAERDRRHWINSTIIGIGLASLCSDMGHEMATTAMPLLLAGMGASSAALGLIEGLSDGAASFAKLFSGHFSDRLHRRKPLAVVGYFLTAAGMASFAWATQWWHVLVGRMGGWIGRGARSPVRKVLLAEATTPATYGRAFGLDRAMDSAGAMIGPLLALLLIPFVGPHNIFLVTIIPGVAAALLIAFAVKEKPHEPGVRRPFVSNVAALPGEFKRFLVGVGVAGLADFSNTLLILWAAEAWASRFGAARAGRYAMLCYVGYNAVYTLCCYVAGGLADRWPRHLVLAGGYALAAIPALALMLAGHAVVPFVIAFGFSGLYMGLGETVESSAAAAMLPRELRGTGFGVLDTVNGIGDIASSIVVGALWVVSPLVAMGLVIALTLSGAAIIATSAPRQMASLA